MSGDQPSPSGEKEFFFPPLLWIRGEGKAAQSGKVFAVDNPCDGTSLLRLPSASGADAREAVRAASDCLQDWRRTPPVERSEVLDRIFRRICELREELARIRTLEQGAPIAQGRAEVDFGASYFRYYSREILKLSSREALNPSPGREMLVERIPVGIVGAITPWNAPISSVCRKIAPALTAGCTVVLKPSEFTPLTSLALARIAHNSGLPPGVLNVLFGEAEEIGQTMLDDDRVRLLTFTGSLRTGRYLMERAANKIKRLALELGGNAPFIVFPDADLSRAASDLVSMKCANSGQVCIAPNRVLVSHDIYERFAEKIEERMRDQRAGCGLDPQSTYGPLIAPRFVKQVRRRVSEAIVSGARVRLQLDLPSSLDQSRFFPLTLIEDVTSDSPIVREEIFGPVITLIPFDSEKEAIEKANATDYGLAAYLYTGSEERLERCLGQLEFGAIGVNDSRPVDAAAPFGGVKQSGIGREGGREGLLEFMEARVLSRRIGESDR